MGKRHFGIVTLAATAVLAGTAGSAAASADHTIAMWDMDESSRSRVMYDSSDHGLDGRIGREVERTGDYYRFSRLEPDTPPTHPQHLVTVGDDAELDPGSRDYAVTIRMRTRYQFGNIIQKGQATVSGGSFKLQIPNGHVQCWFRGSAGSVLVTAPNKINDGRWHVVNCERSHDGVALRVDGRTVARGWGWTGSVSNSWPVSIGGKTDCDQRDVGCDYFAGDLDYVAIDVDGHAW
jgi:hypothetical protein